MKTSRRHELQTNELADRLSGAIETIKPYTRLILGVLVLLAVAGISAAVVSNRSHDRQAAGWEEYFQAHGQLFNGGGKEKLEDTARKYAGTPVGYWSSLALADVALNQGTDLLLKDKRQANQQLQDAVDRYSNLAENSREPLVVQRALLGLARSHESLGKLDKARQEYRQLSEKYPKSAMAQVAERRERDLGQNPTKEFYDWLASYEPTPNFSNEPGRPGVKPDFSELPDASDLKLPSVLDKSPTTSSSPASGPSAPTDPKNENASVETNQAAPGSASPETNQPSSPIESPPTVDSKPGSTGGADSAPSSSK